MTARGMSLLELALAVAFLGLLLAGTAGAFRAGLDGWSRVNRALTAQRALRWAMDRLGEDLRMAGHLFPPPEFRSLDLPAEADPRLQAAFRLAPGRGGDDLSFVMDAPVPVPVVLDRAVPEDGTPLRLRPERDLDLAAGDLLLVPGLRFEHARAAAPAKLAAGMAAPVPVLPPLRHPHGPGTPVQVVRPLRLVRYAVVPTALEGRGGGRVPCLVRFETGYPGDRRVPAWDRLPGEVVAEHVTGFRVDLTLDRRFPGIRGEDFRETAGNLATRLRALGEAAADPLWFRRHGGLVQVELETGDPGRGPPLRRAQALVLAPGNFGL